MRPHLPGRFVARVRLSGAVTPQMARPAWPRDDRRLRCGPPGESHGIRGFREGATTSIPPITTGGATCRNRAPNSVRWPRPLVSTPAPLATGFADGVATRALPLGSDFHQFASTDRAGGTLSGVCVGRARTGGIGSIGHSGMGGHVRPSWRGHGEVVVRLRSLRACWG